jgi:integrase
MMDDCLSRANFSKEEAVYYRNGLSLALLASIPLRPRAFQALRIGYEILKSAGEWQIGIPQWLDKSGKSSNHLVPKLLTPYLNWYITHYRPGLLKGRSSDFLWIGRRGEPMRQAAMAQAVADSTSAALGERIRPHAFRRAAAMFWAQHSPESVLGTKDLLNHSGFSTTNKYYLMAQTTQAGRVLAEINLGRINRKKRAPKIIYDPTYALAPMRTGREWHAIRRRMEVTR